MMYCHLVKSREMTDLRDSREAESSEGVFVVHIAWRGAQKPPRPSVYALPFCEMIDWMSSG